MYIYIYIYREQLFSIVSLYHLSFQCTKKKQQKKTKKTREKQQQQQKKTNYIFIKHYINPT